MKSSLLFASFILLAGCTGLTTTYTARDAADVLATPEAKAPALIDAEAPVMDTWWQRFNDPALEDLLARAFKQNRSLAASRATLQAARAAYKYQEGTLWPTVDINGGITRNRTSENGLSGRNRYTNYNLAGDASWELDFFGHNQTLIDAAEAEAEAATADLRAAWVSVSAEISARYLELRTLQARLFVARNNLNAQQETYNLVKDRYEAGIGDALALYQAEYNLQTTHAVIPSLLAGIENCKNVLAILCGMTPGTLPAIVTMAPESQLITVKEEGETIVLRPSGIPQPEALDLDAGIPADLIRRRPDVMAAERRLKAAYDYLGNAEMERLPRLYISGSIGLDSLHISDVFDWDSRFYRFGPGISLPIFRGGRINANIEIRTEQQKAALAIYEETVLAALAEVRNALADYDNEKIRLQALRAAVTAAANAYEVADDKWQKGLVDFQNVLDAQRNMLNLDESRVASEGNIAAAQIRLFKSLCGGWQGEVTDTELEAYFFGSDEPVEEAPTTPATAETAAAETVKETAPAAEAETAPAAETTEAALPEEDLPAEELIPVEVTPAE